MFAVAQQRLFLSYTSLSFFQEYKVSNFEQRLMNEIEFRLERTPVEESDDEVQHDDVPTGRCIAPIFDKKLKNFKATEGVPVTFSCKIVGIPVPKVREPDKYIPLLKKDLLFLEGIKIQCVSSINILRISYLQHSPIGVLVQGREADLEEKHPLQEVSRGRRDLLLAH